MSFEQWKGLYGSGHPHYCAVLYHEAATGSQVFIILFYNADTLLYGLLRLRLAMTKFLRLAMTYIANLDFLQF